MSFTPLHADEKDFEDAVEAIAPDMPLLMHGCGDVAPSDVNPETARLVAQLTVKHISELVDAAVDAHHILTDGAGGLLPPPPLANKRKEVSSSSTFNQYSKTTKGISDRLLGRTIAGTKDSIRELYRGKTCG